MKFYSYGKDENPVIFLLPGTCCHWKANFGEVLPLLEPYFYVVCVSYDGFDEAEESEFPDMITETEKIELFIQDHFNGHIQAAYGCSLGGSFVGLLVQRKRIHIDHGILGSSDLDQSGALPAKIQASMIAPVLSGLLKKGKIPDFMKKKMKKMPKEDQEYLEKMMELFGMGNSRMSFVTKRSIRHQFYSDLVTPLYDDISVPNTTIHCFYAAKMGEKYLKRYKQHFQNPDIRRHELQHEELLMRYPKEWVQEVMNCCGM